MSSSTEMSGPAAADGGSVPASASKRANATATLPTESSASSSIPYGPLGTDGYTVRVRAPAAKAGPVTTVDPTYAVEERSTRYPASYGANVPAGWSRGPTNSDPTRMYRRRPSRTSKVAVASIGLGRLALSQDPSTVATNGAAPVTTGHQRDEVPSESHPIGEVVPHEDDPV